MSIELIGIIFLGVFLGVEVLVIFAISLRTLRYVARTQRAIAGLVVQGSEKIQQLPRE